ncbi:MAG TPA: hypothetical protein VF062_01165 [Candidatus Limnocylindrales bacterium]
MLIGLPVLGSSPTGTGDGVGLVLSDSLTLGDGLGLADGLALGLADGLVDSDGLVDGLALGEVLRLGDGLALGEALGLGDGLALGEALGLGDWLGLVDGLSDTDGLGDGVETGFAGQVWLRLNFASSSGFSLTSTAVAAVSSQPASVMMYTCMYLLAALSSQPYQPSPLSGSSAFLLVISATSWPAEVEKVRVIEMKPSLPGATKCHPSLPAGTLASSSVQPSSSFLNSAAVMGT